LKQILQVDLDTRSYEIIISPDLLQNSKPYLDPIIAGRRVAVVSDKTVSKKYMNVFSPILDSITLRWDLYLIDGGEDAKSFRSLEILLDRMLSDGLDRNSLIIAFGGGVVGDVAGFAASLIMRGVEFVQIPTTLMSQVDSAVGGKNAINTRQGKNLVGSFLQPRIVLNDVSLLSSLPLNEMKSGYGEIIKYGLLRGNEEFTWLENNFSKIFSLDNSALVEVIRMGCETKSGIVIEDELDRGKRALVNLGHTFAHAFETHAGFGKFQHGLSVELGLIAACDLSERIGVCKDGISKRVLKHAYSAKMPVKLDSLSKETLWKKEELFERMLRDKKTINGKINFVLLNDIGKPFVCNEVPRESVYETLMELGAV